MAQATMERNPYIEVAFSALEKDNVFVQRYEQATGVRITPLLSTGVPYFFGGQGTRELFKARMLTQSSSYGQAGELYLRGFDCVGFTRWVQKMVGVTLHPPLDVVLQEVYDYTENRRYFSRNIPMPKVAQALQVGDLLVTQTTSKHVLMYIGTLEDYGFTAKDSDALAPYLRYPLVIHCGNNPNYYDRTEAYLRKEKGWGAVRPSKGGVSISLVGVGEAPHVKTTKGAKAFHYFTLHGYELSIHDITHASTVVWWRTNP